jgi:hypothetical protein
MLPNHTPYRIETDQPQGMILAFTLVILTLMSLMGIVILSNSRTELNITGNVRMSQEAFNAADSCARIAILMTLLVLHPDLGSHSQALSVSGQSPTFPLEIEIDNTKLNLANITTGADDTDYVQRYVRAGVGEGSAVEEPHITFKVGEKVVATAVLSVEKKEIIPPGASISETSLYDMTNGYKYKIQLVTTVRGLTNFSAASEAEEPNSIITAMYREFSY